MGVSTTILTDDQKAQFVTDITDYGTDFVAPLFATVESIEAAILKSDHIRTMDGMASCMDMVRQELVDAGIISEQTPPMFVANAVLAHVAELRNEIKRLEEIERDQEQAKHLSQWGSA